jgi:hypothetical protein
VRAWRASLRAVLSHGFARRLIWVLFAIAFYQSGLAATVWLLEAENFRGGIDWLWLTLFPVLLPLFFVVNRFCGCASGACAAPGKEHVQRRTI